MHLPTLTYTHAEDKSKGVPPAKGLHYCLGAARLLVVSPLAAVAARRTGPATLRYKLSTRPVGRRRRRRRGSGGRWRRGKAPRGARVQGGRRRACARPAGLRAAGCWLQHAACRMQDAGCGLQAAGWREARVCRVSCAVWRVAPTNTSLRPMLGRRNLGGGRCVRVWEADIQPRATGAAPVHRGREGACPSSRRGGGPARWLSPAGPALFGATAPLRPCGLSSTRGGHGWRPAKR